MKKKIGSFAAMLFVISCVSAFAGDTFLFEQNFAGSDRSTVIFDDGWDGFETIINIGFSAGRRVVHNGVISLLNHVIPDSALAVLSNAELRLLRNTIFARHGMIFQSNDLRTHFQQFHWYNPRSNNVDNRLTEIDRINIENIRIFENARPNPRLNRRDLARGWMEMFPVPSWTPEIEINDDNTISGFRFGEDNWRGTFRIENGFLVALVTEQFIGNPDYINRGGWRWPAGVTHRDGRLVFNEPIRLVFPVGEPTIYTHYSDWSDDSFLIQRRQIGSLVWTSWVDN